MLISTFRFKMFKIKLVDQYVLPRCAQLKKKKEINDKIFQFNNEDYFDCRVLSKT